MANQAETPKDTRSVQQIREQMAAARARVSASVEGLVVQTNPATIKAKAVDEAKSFATEQITNVEAPFKDASGGWRVDRLAMVGGAVVGVISFLLTIRALLNRGRKKKG